MHQDASQERVNTYVAQCLKDNPELSQDEIIKKLQEIKDGKQPNGQASDKQGATQEVTPRAEKVDAPQEVTSRAEKVMPRAEQVNSRAKSFRDSVIKHMSHHSTVRFSSRDVILKDKAFSQRLHLSGLDEESLPRKILFDGKENDNDGFLSPNNGFMPYKTPLASFVSKDKKLKEWDDLVQRLRDGMVFKPSEFYKQVEEIPCFHVDDLSDKELLRASAVLGNILQLYWWVGANYQKPREDLMDLWAQVRKKLGWFVEDEDGEIHWSPLFNVIEYAMYNWMQASAEKTKKETYDVDELTLEGLRILVPSLPEIDDEKSQKNFYMSLMLMMARAAKLPLLCTEAQEAAALEDDDLLAQALIGIIKTLEKVISAFQDINPHHGRASNYVEAVLFAKTFANYTVGMAPTKVTPEGKRIISTGTGQSFPIFQLLDVFFNRKIYSGKFGNDVFISIRLYPKRWRKFIMAIKDPDGKNTTHVDKYIRKSGNRELEGLYAAALNMYSGDKGLLGKRFCKYLGCNSLTVN